MGLNGNSPVLFCPKGLNFCPALGALGVAGGLAGLVMPEFGYMGVLAPIKLFGPAALVALGDGGVGILGIFIFSFGTSERFLLQGWGPALTGVCVGPVGLLSTLGAGLPTTLVG